VANRPELDHNVGGMESRRDQPVRVLERADLSATCFRLALVASVPIDAVPGQFAMIACGPGADPFLRRAFSLAGVRTEGPDIVVELLVKEVGRGTALLRTTPEGAVVRALAPLGRGYTLGVGGGERLALLAGGIGLPPVLFAAETLAGRGIGFDLFFGATTAAELIELERCRRAVEAAGGELIATTDDGSLGEPGFVTQSLARRLDAGAHYARVLACGPDAMLKAVARLAARHDLAAEVSLEEPMACGVGVCLGCVVELADGRLVPSCREGPVFSTSRLAERWSL
jgi:dihydroorotate dehydrogenase electron transfer subunit